MTLVIYNESQKGSPDLWDSFQGTEAPHKDFTAVLALLRKNSGKKKVICKELSNVEIERKAFCPVDRENSKYNKDGFRGQQNLIST